MTNKYVKRCSKSFIISKIHIKTTMRYHYMPTRMTKAKILLIPIACEDVEQQEPSHLMLEMYTGLITFENFDIILINRKHEHL